MNNATYSFSYTSQANGRFTSRPSLHPSVVVAAAVVAVPAVVAAAHPAVVAAPRVVAAARPVAAVGWVLLVGNRGDCLLAILSLHDSHCIHLPAHSGQVAYLARY